MSICEVCGIASSFLNIGIFERQRVQACKKCFLDNIIIPVKSGYQPTRRIQLREPNHNLVSKNKFQEQKKEKNKIQKDLEDEDLIENYHNVVRKAREQRGLTQEKLANMINEKTSVISKIETGKWVAPNNVIKKLEHLLKINITEG